MEAAAAAVVKIKRDLFIEWVDVFYKINVFHLRAHFSSFYSSFFRFDFSAQNKNQTTQRRRAEKNSKPTKQKSIELNRNL